MVGFLSSTWRFVPRPISMQILIETIGRDLNLVLLDCGGEKRGRRADGNLLDTQIPVPFESRASQPAQIQNINYNIFHRADRAQGSLRFAFDLGKALLRVSRHSGKARPDRFVCKWKFNQMDNFYRYHPGLLVVVVEGLLR